MDQRAWDVAVVDASGPSRRHLEIGLQAAGYRTVGWADGDSARRELAAFPPRLLLSELLMSHLDGFDLLAWARAQWGGTVELVATTGVAWGHVSLSEIVRQRFEARFLPKPFLRSEAVALVRASIGAPTGLAGESAPAEWRIGVAEAQRADLLAEEYERRLVRLGGQQGRCSLRAWAECSVRVHQRGQWVEGKLGNLSAGGLFIESDHSPDPDEVLEISLEIPALARGVRAQARVAYRVPPDRVAAGEAPGYGLQFLDLGEEERRALNQLVLDLRAQHDDWAEATPTPMPVVLPEETAPAEAAPAPTPKGASSRSKRQGPRAWVLLVGLPAQQLLGRPGFLLRRGFEVMTAPVVEDAEDLARVRKPALCLVHEKAIRADPQRLLSRLGKVVEAPGQILLLGPTTLSSLLAAGLCGAVLRPDIPPLLLQDEIRQRLGIVERTAMRVLYRAPVRIGALGQQFDSEMLDMSVGGMLVRSPPGLAIGTKVELTFDLPSRPGVSVVGAVVRSQRERGEKAGRSGLAFVDLDASARDAIRRFVQSHVAFREFFGWLKEAYFE